jgi:hypothetical protein
MPPRVFLRPSRWMVTLDPIKTNSSLGGLEGVVPPLGGSGVVARFLTAISTYPVLLQEVKYSDRVVADILASSSGACRISSTRSKELSRMPCETTTTTPRQPAPRAKTGSSWFLTNRAARTRISSWDSASARGAPNRLPSADPKFRSRRSGTLARRTCAVSGMAREDGPCRGEPWASMIAWAVLAARCKSDEKTWVTEPTSADRVARWDARRRAWRTPWAVRGESRIPALGAVSLRMWVVEKWKLTRGRRRCRPFRHDGREGDALYQVIRAVVKCRALMRGKRNREASWPGDAL